MHHTTILIFALNHTPSTAFGRELVINTPGAAWRWCVYATRAAGVHHAQKVWVNANRKETGQCVAQNHAMVEESHNDVERKVQSHKIWHVQPWEMGGGDPN